MCGSRDGGWHRFLVAIVAIVAIVAVVAVVTVVTVVPAWWFSSTGIMQHLLRFLLLSCVTLRESPVVRGPPNGFSVQDSPALACSPGFATMKTCILGTLMFLALTRYLYRSSIEK